MGTVAKVKQVLKTQGENLRVLVTGVCRGKITEMSQTEPFMSGIVEAVPAPDTGDSLRAHALRREAVNLGMEHVKVKNGLMIVRFVGDDKSPYYRSEAFMDMLRKITAQPDRFVLKQKDGKLAMTVRRVESVATAVEVLKSL